MACFALSIASSSSLVASSGLIYTGGWQQKQHEPLQQQRTQKITEMLKRRMQTPIRKIGGD